MFTADEILLIPDIVKNAIEVNQWEKQIDGRLKYWYTINQVRYTVLIAEFDPIEHKRTGEYLFSFFTDRKPHTNGDILKQKEVKKKELSLRYNTKTDNSKLSGLPTDFSIAPADNNTNLEKDHGKINSLG